MKERRKKCAIVVDDHEDQRLFSRCVLEENGWEVMEASDGSEALALAKKTRPDLILSDVMMPSMDGFSLCSALRADEQFDQTVFIFLTATFRDPQDEKTGHALGADGYIRQPVQPEYLRSRIEELVNKGRASRPNSELRTGDHSNLSLYAKTMVRKLEKKLQELTKAQEQLSQVKTERENFFHMGLDLQCVATIDGRFLDVNESWIQTLGFTREELLNTPYTDFIHPDDLESTKEAMRKLESGRNVYTFRNRYRTRDGQWRWLEWRSSVSHGNVIYATARDVTEQYRLSPNISSKSEISKTG